MSISWTYDPDGLAYISLTDERTRGMVETSVLLSDLAAEEGVESLHSIAVLSRMIASTIASWPSNARSSDRLGV